MYGTIARFQLKAGTEPDVLIKQLREDVSRTPGIVGVYIYKMDVSPNEYYMSVVFESKEKYWANAQSPEQDARYRKLAAYFASEPEWHDGEITYVRKEPKLYTAM